MQTNRKLHLCLLLLVCFFTFFIHNKVVYPDIMESRNLITAREMVEYNNWLVPTMNGTLRLEKPPLPTWVAGVIEWIAPDNIALQRTAAGMMAMLLVFLFTLNNLKGKSAHEKYVKLQGLKAAFLALTLLGLGIPLVASLPLVIILRRLRNMPHKCPACGTSMNKVDEVHDNEFLSPSQDLEERVGSVDYDVWLCPSCGEKDIEQY